MKMTLEQTKLVGLTMKLDLKVREYKELCKKLEELKKSQIDPNDEVLIDLKNKFQENHNEILNINKQLKDLQNIKLINKDNEKNKVHKPNSSSNKNETEKSTQLVEIKNVGIIKKIMDKIRSWLRRGK